MHNVWGRRSRRLLTFFGTPVAQLPQVAPNEIADLWAWYDASDLTTLYQDAARTIAVTTNGESVGSWGDKSGGGRHANQVGAATTLPTYQTGIQNSLPALLFDGGDFLDTTGTLNSFPITIIGIGRTSTTVGTNRGIVSVQHSVNGGSRSAFTTTDRLRITITSPSTASTSLTVYGANTSYNWGMRATSSTIDSIDSGVITPAAHTALAVNNILSVGRLNVNTTSSLMNGYLMEIAAYNRALTDNEVGQVCAYLKTKWAVT